MNKSSLDLLELILWLIREQIDGQPGDPTHEDLVARAKIEEEAYQQWLIELRRSSNGVDHAH